MAECLVEDPRTGKLNFEVQRGNIQNKLQADKVLLNESRRCMICKSI